jgi:hypothetical protein
MFRGAPSVTGLTVGAHGTRNDVGCWPRRSNRQPVNYSVTSHARFGHGGLVNAAWAITEGEARRRA